MVTRIDTRDLEVTKDEKGGGIFNPNCMNALANGFDDLILEDVRIAHRAGPHVGVPDELCVVGDLDAVDYVIGKGIIKSIE